MPFGDDAWKKRNPETFEVLGSSEDATCDCGEKLVEKGIFHGTQDHPWRPPRVECDCGKMHQIVGMRRGGETS